MNTSRNLESSLTSRLGLGDKKRGAQFYRKYCGLCYVILCKRFEYVFTHLHDPEFPSLANLQKQYGGLKSLEDGPDWAWCKRCYEELNEADFDEVSQDSATNVAGSEQSSAASNGDPEEVVAADGRGDRHGDDQHGDDQHGDERNRREDSDEKAMAATYMVPMFTWDQNPVLAGMFDCHELFCRRPASLEAFRLALYYKGIEARVRLWHKCNYHRRLALARWSRLSETERIREVEKHTGLLRVLEPELPIELRSAKEPLLPRESLHEYLFSVDYDLHKTCDIHRAGFLVMGTMTSTACLGDFYQAPRLALLAYKFHVNRCVVVLQPEVFHRHNVLPMARVCGEEATDYASLSREEYPWPRLPSVRRVDLKRCRAGKYVFKLNSDYRQCIERCYMSHQPSWIHEGVYQLFSYWHLLSHPSRRQAGSTDRVQMISVEVWKETSGDAPSGDVLVTSSGEEMVAGEIGVLSGRSYTSLTGFTRVKNTGKIQLLALHAFLVKHGFMVWDLGMHLDYKTDLGADLIMGDDWMRIMEEASNPRTDHPSDNAAEREDNVPWFFKCLCEDLLQPYR
ncbi:leucyl/phenylalanyl-tRNA protein transferase [Gregarina niphandrodes]|uniref:Leucyl/phenylalanyl-tRNA protein transferase n=1 Tax=Gregarina niphandrodes TaxID=110365 RepID=A0A023BB70_GRENI|nr:leucyl/phenylalanyl-tRNA protein transferase [Gregarina niphandrodes]EZG78784.1 leucyl/phenylalanyl-tRNA protein transferase [Gregarina niphandrodes]|eukprot:XP_011129198.1 leucyl/phenylalanyl-tRNA protein transferase [Gregarina niphandrodes]